MIKRVPNKDIPINKLRLQSSERNENWPEKLFDLFTNSITQSDIKFYPNLDTLYSKLKSFYKVDDLAIGNGSDRCIEHFIQAHKEKYKKLIVFDPCFPMYPIYGQLYNLEIIRISHTNLTIPYEEFLRNVDKDSIVILTNPTSPLGQILPSSFIDQVLEKNVPTLLDEAYLDFSDASSYLGALEVFPNLFVVRTFSKGLGSAGIRLGLIASNKENMDLIRQFRPMYEITTFTAKWGKLLLENYDIVQEYIDRVKNTRKQIIERCDRNNIPIIPGHSNWIHIIYDNLPDHIIFKTNCKIPGDSRDWVRLQITSNINDYLWL